MPATVNANKMSLVHKSSVGISTIFPDACKTPTPGGPVPIPYPNIAMSSDTADGASTVKADGNPLMLKSSNYSRSSGDEAGTAMGVVSNKNMGKATPVMTSMDVKADGNGVMRLTDMMQQNVGGSGNTPPGTNLQPPVIGIPIDVDPCKTTNEKAKQQAADGTSWGKSGIVGEHHGPIQTAASDEQVVLYFRATKAICGKWISMNHRPKPHSCISGTTIKGGDADAVQAWLNDLFSRMHIDEEALYPAAAPPEVTNRFYSRNGADYIGIVGQGVGGGKIKPLKGSGRQTISYDGKWMTGDYDLFEVLKIGDACEKVTGDDFAKVRDAVNKGCNWDAIQHPAQAQWEPDKAEQASGIAKFDMNVEVKKVLQGKSPLDHAIEFHKERNPMPVIDSPLTIVSAGGSIALDEKQDVKDALICQGCAK
jgi:hypothetical protein